jgi:hypothetical protein
VSEAFLRHVAKEEGFEKIVFKHVPHEGLVMDNQVLVDFNDPALILHEIAHLKRKTCGVPIDNGLANHDGLFADIFTELVRKYMSPTPVNLMEG